METVCSHQQLIKLLDQLEGLGVTSKQFTEVLASGYIPAIFDLNANLHVLAELRRTIGLGPERTVGGNFVVNRFVWATLDPASSKLETLGFKRLGGFSMLSLQHVPLLEVDGTYHGSFLRYVNGCKMKDIVRDLKGTTKRLGTFGEFLLLMDQAPEVVLEALHQEGVGTIEIPGTIFSNKSTEILRNGRKRLYHPYVTHDLHEAVYKLHFDNDRRTPWGPDHLIFIVEPLQA